VGYYEGSGAFAWACIVPRFFTDATGGAELVTASRCVKAMLGWRIFTRELGCATPRANDLLEDNRAVLDGTESSLDRLSKESRYVCARYAMLRAAKDGGAVFPRKVASAENVADLMTKPLTGADFFYLRRKILGLPEGAD
jgi:hypothetical protein